MKDAALLFAGVVLAVIGLGGISLIREYRHDAHRAGCSAALTTVVLGGAAFCFLGWLV